MNCLTVSLFGHREIDDLCRLDSGLAPILRELIQTEEYVSFFIGRSGEFDEYAASVIKRVQKETEREKSALVLVLPYKVSDIDYYEKYYDDIIIPESVYDAHPKAAITLRNRWMIEKSEIIIVYVEHDGGGAYAAMKYAEKLNKRIINLYTG